MEYMDPIRDTKRVSQLPNSLLWYEFKMEIDEGGDEALATDALDLIRSVIQDNEELAEELSESLSSGGDPNNSSDNQPPDLIHLTTMILEEALSRSQARTVFVHGEIWVEHLSWKYAQLGDTFEIGRRLSSFYDYVLKQSPPALGDRPFPALSQALADVLLHKATTSTIKPLVSSIAVAPHILGTLYASLVLSYKQSIPYSSKPCLPEQALCARVAGGAGFTDSTRSRIDPVDILANYVKGWDIGTAVPLESIRVLYALCAFLSVTQPSNPEATVVSFVRIVQHPCEDLALRNAVWNFIAFAQEQGEDDSKKHMSALEVANETLSRWKDLWEANPQLLASVFRFIYVVWQHGLEHKNLIDTTRGNDEFWTNVVAVVKEELSPNLDYETETFIILDDECRSSLHEAVSVQSYRNMVKSYAVRVIGQAIFLQPQSGSCEPAKKPLSYSKLAPSFKSEDQLNELILEAKSTSYDPSLSDKLAAQLQQDFPGLSLTHLQLQDLSDERQFGDDFMFSIALLRSRMQQCVSGDDMANAVEEVEKRITSLNLNLSLTYAQTALTKSWQFLLHQVLPFVRPVPEIRLNLLSLSAMISGDLALKKR
ncbi:uncharacterized protein F5891DRAFT_1258611 [Suillus fuscotomentosus]|uniref:Uncharacterized protein n=1 Tax=Suillus fuscotomentosus TaxID=1912939 RepID=A0AAD4DTH4_9AGAM|nr:uncharacterized protein F5891DRAFT_1258611 [Suillus fuscotomentosus]KAG1893566.1 hypothetical protein F5891DRAFT_1258611 [Suillus fuscotomentosus]